MGKLIHHTVTITITESWTITWTEDAQADSELQPQATTIVQDQPKPPAEPDVTFQTTITTVESADPSASDPRATPTPAAASTAQTDDATPKPRAGSQRKRPRRRRAGGDQGGM